MAHHPACDGSCRSCPVQEQCDCGSHQPGADEKAGGLSSATATGYDAAKPRDGHSSPVARAEVASGRQPSDPPEQPPIQGAVCKRMDPWLESEQPPALPVRTDDSLPHPLEQLLPHYQHDEAWPCERCARLRAAIRSAIEEAEKRGAKSEKGKWYGLRD